MKTKKCEIFLVSTGQKKIEVIKVIREYTGLGLKEAKELAESAPGAVWSGAPGDVAQKMKLDLELAGAIAEVRGDSAFGWNTRDSDTDSGYAVFLSDPGSKKIDVIKVLREYTDLGLKEAKDLVESAPREVRSGVSREVAEKMKTELEHAGALAEITGGSAFGWASKKSDSGPTCEVILTDLGPNTIEVIKVIRNYTGLGLKEAKELAESAPGTVCSGVGRDVAENIKRDLERAGATAQIRSS